MESSPVSPLRNPSHGISFWKMALHDALASATIFLLGSALFIQIAAVVGVFWSRAQFGANFDPEVYSVFAAEKSNASVISTFGLEEALIARREENAPVRDAVTRTVERAEQEIDQTRARQKESDLVRQEAERQAQACLQLAETALNQQSVGLAYEHLLKASEMAPDYLPTVRSLAFLHERRQDFGQARFQWERAVGLVPPNSPEMQAIQQNLERVERLQADALRNQETPPAVPVTAFRTVTPNSAVPVLAGPNRISLKQVVREDLPLEDLYDLHFHLRIVLAATGGEPTTDISRTRVEIDFFDQSHSAAGTLIPMRVKNATLQPKQTWVRGSDQTLTLKYTLPRGYLREKGRIFGSSYGFCGYVARVFYRGELQDAQAQPNEILGKFVAKGSVGPENQP